MTEPRARRVSQSLQGLTYPVWGARALPFR